MPHLSQKVKGNVSAYLPNVTSIEINAGFGARHTGLQDAPNSEMCLSYGGADHVKQIEAAWA